MNDTMINSLAEIAVQTAARAANDYLRAHRLTADTDTLIACINANAKIRLPEALRDAKEAFAAGMDQIATRTFLATLALAGIDAAKEAGFRISAMRPVADTIADLKKLWPDRKPKY